MSGQTNRIDSSRRRLLLGGTALSVLATTGVSAPVQQAQAQTQTAPAAGGRKPNTLVMFGDDIGQTSGPTSRRTLTTIG